MVAIRKAVGELLDAVPRQPKIKRSAYQESGRFPIVDQSQAAIAGYTDDDSWLYTGTLPVVVFGDHTRKLKFVDFPFCVGADGTQLLRAVGGNDIHYFYYALRNVDLSNYGYERHFKYLKKEEIEVPPLPEQRRIAGILSAYDDLIENNQRRVRILEEMARSLYGEWFVHFHYPGHESVPLVESPLGQIPQGWEVKKLGDVAATFRGRSYRSVDLADEGGVPFLNLKCLDRDGGFRRSGLKRYVGEFKEAHLARKGDIVMAVTDMTQERRIVARAALVPSLDNEFGVFSMDLVRIEPKGEMPKSFLYSFFRYSSFADEVKQHANGANVLHLSPERITDFRFSVPPVDLMEHFVRFVAPTLERMDVLQNQTANLRRTRDLLLPRLLSGQINVDPTETLIEEAIA